MNYESYKVASSYWDTKKGSNEKKMLAYDRKKY